MECLVKIKRFGVSMAIINIAIAIVGLYYDIKVFWVLILLSITTYIYVQGIISIIDMITNQTSKEIIIEIYVKPIYRVSIVLYIVTYMFIALWYSYTINQ